MRSGNGWYGWDLGLDATAETLARLRAAGQRPAGLGELEITITPPGTPDPDTVRRYADLGVHRLVVQPHTMDGTAIEDLITTMGETLVGI